MNSHHLNYSVLLSGQDGIQDWVCTRFLFYFSYKSINEELLVGQRVMHAPQPKHIHDQQQIIGLMLSLLVQVSASYFLFERKFS